MTDSDHEVIAFTIISKHAQKVDSSLNATYNVQKADWENFKKNLQSNYASTKFEMQILMMTSNIENMKKMTILLRSTIEKAINENISKRRSCNQSKVWWSKNLTNKRKIMTYEKRQWKSSRVQSNWNLFKRERNDYFYAIRKAKNKSWTEFLNNAKGREVFQAYKYTKPRSVEKLLFISHNDEIRIHFEEKCNALIEAIFSPSVAVNIYVVSIGCFYWSIYAMILILSNLVKPSSYWQVLEKHRQTGRCQAGAKQVLEKAFSRCILVWWKAY